MADLQGIEIDDCPECRNVRRCSGMAQRRPRPRR
ncbi:MAG: hypothetical protein M3Q71_03730 [Chloroflexota bacterium]|nr:hypothetical protein [Chloroflexota bacterium]